MKDDITNQQLLTALTGTLVTITDNMVTKKDLKATEEKFTGQLKATEEKFTSQLQATEDKFTGQLKATEDKFTGQLKATEKKLTGKLKATETKLSARMATKDDLKLAQVRLESKIRSSHTVNIRHHLETRQAIGDLNRRLTKADESFA